MNLGSTKRDATKGSAKRTDTPSAACLSDGLAIVEQGKPASGSREILCGPPTQIQEANTTVAELDAAILHPGFKRVCMFCHQPLPGSDPKGTRTSHGMHWPACDATPAEWREYAGKANGGAA